MLCQAVERDELGALDVRDFLLVRLAHINDADVIALRQPLL